MHTEIFNSRTDIAPFIPQLAQTYKDCFAEPPWYEAFLAGEVEDDLRQALTKSHGVIVIAREGDAIVGAAVGYGFSHRTDMHDLLEAKTHASTYYYAELFVASKYRGLGVAHMLIAAREAYALQHNYTKAVVRTSVAQTIIQDIYLARAFSIIARQHVLSDKVINNVPVRVPDERVIMCGPISPS